MFKKIICIIISFIIITSIIQITALANTEIITGTDSPKENKIICNASIDEEFVSDELIVVFNNETSLKLKNYTTDDFKEISAVSVKNLTNYTTEAIKQQREGKSALSLSSEDSNYISEDNYHQFFLIKLDKKSKENVLRSIKLLEQRDDVISVSPNYTFKVDLACPSTHDEATLDEVKLSSSTNNIKSTTTLNDTYANQQWALGQIDLFSAWNYQTNYSTVRVGILDTGINHLHTDLLGKVNVSLSKDFSDENNPLYTTAGHGTAVAGIIGAIKNNNAYIAGVCNNVELVSLKVTYTDTAGEHHLNLDYVCSAIDYASTNNIPILNYSISGTTNYPPFKTKLQNYKGLFICTAGNVGKDIGTSGNNRYPACYDTDNLICVANSDEDDLIYSGEDLPSCYSSKYVDLAAPGTLIYTLKGSSYAKYTGTSVAAPYVTGVAALLKSKYPKMDTGALKANIINNVDYVPALAGKVSTSGRLNAYKALSNPEKFTVRYMPNNGGGSPMSNQEIIRGCSTALRANTYTRAGYTFNCWYAKRPDSELWYYTNGTDKDWYPEGQQPPGYYKYPYRDKQKVSRTAANGKIVEMYAQWKIDKFNLTFNSNNGTNSMPYLTVDYDDSFNIPSNVFFRDGFTFDHWYAKNQDGELYYVNSTNGGWYTIDSRPSGYTRMDIADRANISYDTFNDISNGDTITLCAYWKPNSGELGDADNSGKVNITDATHIQNYLSNTVDEENINLSLADVNFDGKVNISDVTLLNKFLAHSIDEFGV